MGARLLEHFVREPSVVLLDDAQWADPPSLSALQFALRRLAAEPVLVAVTVRTGELPESLSKLAHGRLGEVLRLAPLDTAEVQRLGEALGLTLPARAAQRLPATPAASRCTPGRCWKSSRRSDGKIPRPSCPRRGRTRRSFRAGCRPARPRARGLVEAVAVLGRRRLRRRPRSPRPPVSAPRRSHRRRAQHCPIPGRARRRLGGRPEEPFEALEDAVDAGLLRWDGSGGLRFWAPAARRRPCWPGSARAAGRVPIAPRRRWPPTRRPRSGAGPPQRPAPMLTLAADFEAFAGREAARRQAAATALITASRLSVRRRLA